MSKKSLLANLLYRLGFISLIRMFNKRFRKKLIILAYHRVYDVSYDTEFNSDIELISASIDDFDWQVAYLKKNYFVTTFGEYLSIRKEGQLDRDVIIITFDDGFKDNFDHAYKILKKHDVPAVFFVSTNYIGSSDRFWFEYFVSIINQLDDVLFDRLASIISIPFCRDRSQFIENALMRLKSVPDEKRIHLLQNIQKFCESEAVTIRGRDHKAMSWDNLQEMSNNGMEIGSHTLSHPILSQTSSQQCREELVKSKEVLEKKLKKQCISMSYPNGQVTDVTSGIMDMVEQSGYDFSCSYVSGINEINAEEVYFLKRLHVERYVNRNYFAAFLELPSLFS